MKKEEGRNTQIILENLNVDLFYRLEKIFRQFLHNLINSCFRITKTWQILLRSWRFFLVYIIKIWFLEFLVHILTFSYQESYQDLIKICQVLICFLSRCFKFHFTGCLENIAKISLLGRIFMLSKQFHSFYNNIYIYLFIDSTIYQFILYFLLALSQKFLFVYHYTKVILICEHLWFKLEHTWINKLAKMRIFWRYN